MSSSPSKIFADRLGADPLPNLQPPGRSDILSIIEHTAQMLSQPAWQDVVYEERGERIETYLHKLVAHCILEYEDQPDLLVEVCEYGCSLNTRYGFVVLAGCPIHD